MAIAAATETSVADEAETEPDLEPDTELHLRGRGRRCPVANVKAHREEGEWVRDRLTCGSSGELVPHAGPHRRPA
jgi:hypothetical protein